MRTRAILQPTKTFSGATLYIQEARFAAPVGDAKTGVAFVNAYTEALAGTLTVLIETATHRNVPVTPASGSPFWTNVGSGTLDMTTGVGAMRFDVGLLRALSTWIRYTVQTPSSGAVDLDILVYLADA